MHRDPLPNAQTVASTPIPPSLSEHCLKMALMDEEALWKTFGAHPEGLNAAEVETPAKYMARTSCRRRSRRLVVHLWSAIATRLIYC